MEVWVVGGLLVVVINWLLVALMGHRLLVLLLILLWMRWAHLTHLSLFKPIINGRRHSVRIKVGWLLWWVNSRLTLNWELSLILELVPWILIIKLALIVLLLDNLLFFLLNGLLAGHQPGNFLLLGSFTL